MDKTHRRFCMMLSFMLLFSSCSFYSKSDYLEDFSSFITDIEENHRSYTEEDWLYMDQEYEDFIGENYEKFSDEFTKSEKKQVEDFKTKYQITKLKQKTGDFIDEIGVGIQQLEKIIDRASDLVN